MERFLNRKVIITTCMGSIDGMGSSYKGIITSVDDEFVCLDNNFFVVRKFVMSVKVV